jgi:hypothetical protein
MDQVYAWDQPHLHFYVPGSDHRDHRQGLFEETLGTGRPNVQTEDYARGSLFEGFPVIGDADPFKNFTILAAA